MFTAGCDVGSLSAKAVVMMDGKIVASHIMCAKPEPEESALEVMAMALKSAKLGIKDIAYCVGTGYG